MVKIYKKNKLQKEKRPSINITSIGSERDEYDFMPHINTTAGMPSGQKKIIQSLKNGSYVPNMSQVEYKAEVDPDNKNLIKAMPANSMFEYTELDTFDYLDKYPKEYQAMYKKKRTDGRSTLEMVTQTFDKTNIPIRPRYYHNPLQYFDHILLADGYVNSFAGTCVDTYVDFIMPKTLGPVLKLRNPDKHGTPQEQQKIIEDNQEIIEMLKEVDKFYSDDGVKEQDGYMGMPIQQKFRALILNHLVFGRNCLVFENWEHLPHFEFNGKKYDDIPNVLKTIQSIDMGMAEIDIYTGKLGGIYMYNSVPFVSSKNMIYLVNKFANPMIGSLYYGFSIMQRAIDPVRLYRRILAKNFAQFVRTSYSGMGYFIFDSTQYPQAIRTAIRTAIVNSYKAGEIGIIDYQNIKDLDFKEMKISVNIEALIALQESLVKIMIGLLGMPQSLIFDESASTRATLVGRVVSFINNQVSQLRSSIGEQIAAQWYVRNFRILFKDKPEILEKFTIGVEFEEMDLETKVEKVERLLAETQLNPYKDEYIGEVLNDQKYLDHIDTKKRDEQNQQQANNPFGKMPVTPKSNFKVTDADTGKVSRVESSNK